MKCFYKVIARCPYVIIVAVLVFATTCLVVSLKRTKLPDFSDPQLGFETRGTELSQRSTALYNLQEATRPSGLLTQNPADGLTTPTPQYLVFQIENNTNVVENEENSEEYERTLHEEETWDSLSKGLQDYHKHHQHVSSDGFFCGTPSVDYSHVVMEASNPPTLLSLENLKSMCHLQDVLMSVGGVKEICETVTDVGPCCPTWSLPNYVAVLNNKLSCYNITEEDISATISTLHFCAKFFHNLNLRADCHDLCPEIPVKCTKHNAVYNILNYLVDVEFSPVNATTFNNTLQYSMVFLPMARSTVMLNYYYRLSQMLLVDGDVRVSAMDLGVKNALFDDLLLKDAWLMLLGGFFVIICMWMYSGSLLVTIATVLAIFMSLTVSYFIYRVLFELEFFPFMNLLATVVAIGIGADDAFIFCKVWQRSKEVTNSDELVVLVTDTMNHAVVTMMVTSVTTAAAFFSGYVSNITAIRCFSIYAGTTVMINFVLMITWLPACIVAGEASCCPYIIPPTLRPRLISWLRTIRRRSSQLVALLDRCLITTVIRLRWLWLIVFTCFAVINAIFVLHFPKLKLPDSKDFQLFKPNHLFEVYNLKYRDHFWFEKLEKTGLSNEKFPLTFVWGVLPIDNGDYLDPSSKGSLVFDDNFDIGEPESQTWLLNFCRKVRAQPFYQLTWGPLLPNCFIESFKTWMQRRCKDAIDKIDRTPCCESSTFPFSRSVFNECIVIAMGQLYKTPFLLTGIAGPKFSRNDVGHIKAVVVEYDSNYSYSLSYNDAHELYTQVETWFQSELETAPPSLKRGWFISSFSFYDLQQTLSTGTFIAIICSMTFALVVVFLVTLDVFVTLFSIVTITCVIFVTLGLLVLLGWKLNVLEAVAVSSAIGLAVDFSLHYVTSYMLSEEEGRQYSVISALNKMAGPTFMSALTTGAAGALMLPSEVLPYIQIGMFLVIVMTTSWLYSTVFLMSLLSIAGPQKGFCQFSYKSFIKLCVPDDDKKRCKTFYSGVVSESTSSTSCPLNQNDTHELDSVPRSSRRNKRNTKNEQSPSCKSALTVDTEQP